MDKIKVAKQLVKLAKSLVANDIDEQTQARLDEAQKQGKKYILQHKKGNFWKIMACKNFGNVKKGDFGGFIQSEENLSHEGNCWVSQNAGVASKAKVYEDALVGNNAKIYGQAQVYGRAMIFENAKVGDEAQVYGRAIISGNAAVVYEAHVTDSAICMNNAFISGNAKVCGYACVRDNAIIYDNVTISHKAIVSDDAEIHGNAKIDYNVKDIEITE